MQKYLENLKKIPLQSKVYRDLPETPGIYVYFKNGNPIYIGKAINLKRRIASYFALDLEPKTKALMTEATEISYIQVSSELEALLLEARLIRSYMPKYNIEAKDDKHPLYIQITKEEFPRVITVRKSATKKGSVIATYGPFPSATSVRLVLRMIRKVFPYSDHKIGKRACLYSHIGLCDPCPNEIVNSKDSDYIETQKARYKTNIRHIKAILDGKIESVKKSLEKEMETFSKKEDYEKALLYRNKLQSLIYITRPQMPVDSYLENPNLYEDVRRKEVSELKKILTKNNFKIRKLERIECFDIAHLAGTSVTASMVTFIGGEADKSYYRHFRIRQLKGGSDIDSLKEVIGRRIKNIESWGVPDLIIVDGGVGQVNVFIQELAKSSIEIPVVGIAKHPDRLIAGERKIKLTGPALNLVGRIRDEAHRFARTYHHKLVSRALIDGVIGG